MSMNNWLDILVVFVFALTVTVTSTALAADALIWGENVGYVAAVVANTDDPQGVAIRAAPDNKGEILGHLKAGAKVNGFNEFKSGWVKLREPGGKGWLDLALLRPQPSEGTVVKVDAREVCLPVHKGPAASFEKTSCLNIGESVKLTGVWTSDNWAAVGQPASGWVDGSSIQSPLAPPTQTKSATESKTASAAAAKKGQAWSKPAKAPKARSTSGSSEGIITNFDSPEEKGQIDEERYRQSLEESWDNAGKLGF
jgi:hypothetical protein